MPDQPERKIEELLRTYGAKRRVDAGPPLELHPINRRLLQAEVARVRGQAAQPARRVPSWLNSVMALWPRLAFAAAMVAILGIGTWRISHTNSQPMRLAKVEDAQNPSRSRALAEAERQAPAAEWAMPEDRSSRPMSAGSLSRADIPAAAPPTPGIATKPAPAGVEQVRLSKDAGGADFAPVPAKLREADLGAVAAAVPAPTVASQDRKLDGQPTPERSVALAAQGALDHPVVQRSLQRLDQIAPVVAAPQANPVSLQTQSGARAPLPAEQPSASAAARLAQASRNSPSPRGRSASFGAPGADSVVTSGQAQPSRSAPADTLLAREMIGSESGKRAPGMAPREYRAAPGEPVADPNFTRAKRSDSMTGATGRQDLLARKDYSYFEVTQTDQAIGRFPDAYQSEHKAGVSGAVGAGGFAASGAMTQLTRQLAFGGTANGRGEPAPTGREAALADKLESPLAQRMALFAVRETKAPVEPVASPTGERLYFVKALAPAESEVQSRSQGEKEVLGSFVLELHGNEVRLIDKDGSVYSGQFEDAARPPAFSGGGAAVELKLKQDERAPEGTSSDNRVNRGLAITESGRVVHVRGTNRFQQSVWVQATFQAASEQAHDVTAARPAAVPVMRPAAGRQVLSIGTAPAPAMTSATTLRLVGKVRVGTNEAAFNAVRVAAPRRGPER
jgi:hypothetical protein